MESIIENKKRKIEEQKIKKMEDYEGNKNLRRLKFTSSTTKEIFDKETGETTKSTQETTVKGKLQEPDFVKLYLDDIEVLYRLPKNASNVLYSFLKRMTYKGIIYTNKSLKQEIAIELQLKNIKSIDNHITELVFQQIIKRIDRGTFLMNPNIIAKGKWEDIKGLRIDYDDYGNRQITPKLKNEEVNFKELEPKKEEE